MLTKLVKFSFHIVFEISLWIFLIGLMIGGGVLGGQEGVPSGIFGAFLGLLSFVVLVIPTYGVIATFINIDKNIEILKNK